jgi:AraC-like DNA-binding protein
VRYSEYHPQPPLNALVECFWALESNSEGTPPTPERILPDGCVELILNFASPFVQYSGDLQKLQPRNFIVGQMTQPMLISPTGPVQLIGIRFHPGGTAPFFRIPMHELRNQVVELASFARPLEVKLKAAATEDYGEPVDKVAVLEKLLTSLLLESGSDLRLLGIAAKIVGRAGMISIDDLAYQSGLSGRQLERRFLNDIGVGPKLLSRILRFQQVFRAVEANRVSWPEVAVDCGYYDQAHLIRDFRQFAQQTPSVLFAEQTQLTESFMRKNRMSGFSNTG